MKNNKNLLLNILMIIVGMTCLAYASVPFYKVFCAATGFGGTVRQVYYKSKIKGTKTIKVYFDANLDKSLNWQFYNKQKSIEILTGENALVFYRAENLSNRNSKAVAVYNVTPHRAGKYFSKVHCFCFDEQILKAGQKVDFPVLFYIDPKIESDPNMKDIKSITLSYTFYNIDDKN